jgi:hypothetical protein
MKLAGAGATADADNWRRRFMKSVILGPQGAKRPKGVGNPGRNTEEGSAVQNFPLQ